MVSCLNGIVTMRALRCKVYNEIFGMETAVMAGYRYLTSLKSTPRQLRTRMHERLFRASCEYR